MSRPTAALRRISLPLFAVLATIALGACGDDESQTASAGTGSAPDVTLTVGVPRNFGFLSTLWARNVQPAGVKVEYKYFPVFTDMLTALNSGKIDLTEIGDVGAVQSFVNGGKVQAVAVSEPNGDNCGVLVPKGSKARSFADLKGKKIAFLKSTNSYISFRREVERAGLKEDDFTIVELAGPPANKAFQTEQIDAYYTINPNMADLVEKTGGRVLTLCQDTGVENLYPYVATKDAIADKQQAIGKLLGAVQDNFAWIKANRDEQARLLADKLGFSPTAITSTYQGGASSLQPIDDAFHAREQKVIDELVAAKIVERPVKSQDVFLSTFNEAVSR